MWKLDHKEGWAPKNWCFWTVVLEKTLESPLDCKEIKPVNPKGNQPWIFIGRTDVGRTDAEVEASILWPPDAKSLLTGKDPDAGKDWGQEDRRIRVWQRMRHKFEQAPRDGEGRGSLACCINHLNRDVYRLKVISSVAQLCLTLCDPMDCSMPGFPVNHQLPELVQTHAHWVSDAIQPAHPLSPPSPPAFNLSQHQGLFQWVSSSHQVAKVLEFQLQHQAFQWIFRTDFL